MLWIVLGVFGGLVLFAAWGAEAALLVRVGTVPLARGLLRFALLAVATLAGAGAAGLGAYGTQLLVRPSPPSIAPEAGLQQMREPSTGAVVLQRPDGNVLVKEFDGTVKAVPPESVARLLGDQYGGYEPATAEGIAAEHRRIWERDRDNEAVERSALAALLIGAGVFLRGLKKAFGGSKSARA